MLINGSRFTKILALIFIYLFCSYSSATVVMTGTRVIFPRHVSEQKIQFQNKDDVPNIVQVWLDNGDALSTPDTADAPFIANPSIFKIHPQQGQVIRLLFSGHLGHYPNDRESIFFLNFSSIPTYKKNDIDKNKLLFVIKNRIKVFFRPDNLPVKPHEIGDHLYYSISSRNKGYTLRILNRSPYYANIAHATINFENQNPYILALKNTTMAPFSVLESHLEKQTIANDFGLNIGLINDYGVTQMVTAKPDQE